MLRYPLVRAYLFTWTLGLITAFARGSYAHVQLDQPTRRQTELSGSGLEQKTWPCGRNARSANVTVLQPGQTITVRWTETIQHPGHFRIAFDQDGQDGFQDPVCLTNCDTLSSPTFDFNNDPGILMDNIPDQVTDTYEVQVTLPNVECENCTLQLIQVMYDKPPYTTEPDDPLSDDMYYQCADLALRPGGASPDAGGPFDGGEDAAPPEEDAGVPHQDVGAPRQDAGRLDRDAQSSGIGQPAVTGGGGCRAFGRPNTLGSLLLIVGAVLWGRRRWRASAQLDSRLG